MGDRELIEKRVRGAREDIDCEPQLASLAGHWVFEQIDLSPYSTESNVKVRFRFVTDASSVRDGWYMDDIAMADLPQAVILQQPSNPTSSSLTLSWSASSDPEFAGYEIHRSESPGVSQADDLVPVMTVNDTTNYVDTNLSSKTNCYYRVYVVSSYGTRNGGNEASGVSFRGFDYPFHHGIEAGGSNWIVGMQGGWTVTAVDSAHSGQDHWEAFEDYLQATRKEVMRAA